MIFKKTSIKSRIFFLVLQHCQQNRRFVCSVCLRQSVKLCTAVEIFSLYTLQLANTLHIIDVLFVCSHICLSVCVDKKKPKIVNAIDDINIECNIFDIFNSLQFYSPITSKIENLSMHLIVSTLSAVFLTKFENSSMHLIVSMSDAIL